MSLFFARRFTTWYRQYVKTKNKNKTLLNHQNYGGIFSPPSDIRGKIIFLWGSFALCPRVFLTLTCIHRNTIMSHVGLGTGNRCQCGTGSNTTGITRTETQRTFHS